MDPRNHNGGVFLGLNGIVVKSHGGTDALGFATAVDVAVEMAAQLGGRQDCGRCGRDERHGRPADVAVLRRRWNRWNCSV